MFDQHFSSSRPPTAPPGLTSGSTDLQLSRVAADRYAQLTAVAELNAGRRRPVRTGAAATLRTFGAERVTS